MIDLSWLPVPISMLFVGLMAWFWVWIPLQIVRKAGYPGWITILMLMFVPLGWIFLAASNWPIHRELAWLRLKTGSPVESDINLIERYALDLEARGDWSEAIAVYEELARRTKGEDAADYYRNSAKRLRLRQAEASLADS